jgi:hypothetical protein
MAPHRPKHQPVSRFSAIQKIRHQLERDGFPRLQMLLLVMITGLSGFIASFALLHNGLSTMWLRYLIAFGIAYGVFLLLLWLWLRTRSEDYTDIPDLSQLTPQPGGCSSAHTEFNGQGGEMGGAGASGSFDHPDTSTYAGDATPDPDDSPVSDALGAAAEAEEFAIPLALLVLIAALLLSASFVIYSAPVLFAELLLDGVLATRLYQRLRRLESRHWLETSLRRTFWPFILTGLTLVFAGWAMAQYAPQAHSIGDVLLHARQAE